MRFVRQRSVGAIDRRRSLPLTFGSPDMVEEILYAAGVSAEFRRACAAGWDAIPPPVRRLLCSHGVTVRGIRSVADDMPKFAATPVGISGRMAAHLQAFHRRGRIIVAESHVSLATGRVEITDDPGAYLCHEAGHAFDDVIGVTSNNKSPAFRRAYQGDVSAMTSESRVELLYFTQPRVGRRETFAEAFAVAVGLPTPAFEDQFATAFPRSVAFVRGIIQEQSKAVQ